MTDSITTASAPGRSFTKATVVNGRPTHIRCIDIRGQALEIRGSLFTTVTLEDEWYDDVDDPESLIKTLKASVHPTPDIFSFWQRMPDIQARPGLHTEWEDIAVLPIQSYDHWWKNQIKTKVRGLIRKAEREGLVVKEVPFDDDFVRGMTTIFNESPVRQGRPFWHYGKSFETIKEQFSRYVHRERMIGAYVDGEMVGFVMLGDAGKFGFTGQIISSIKHRDRSPNNALIAKAVEICAREKLGYLIYVYWTEDSLGDFKRHCGFERVSVPRYFVPLTPKGKLVLKLGLHRGLKAAMPTGLKASLKQLRSRWYEFRAR